MKKKTMANLIMVAIILVIAVAGVLGVGYIQGWFDKDDGSQAVLRDIVGVIDLQRDGVSYPATDDTVLRKGDKLTCQNGATAVIQLGEDTVVIGENAVLSVTESSSRGFTAKVSFGQVFANCENRAVFTFDDYTAIVEDSVIFLSVRSGAQTVTVLSGSVDGVSAGNSMEYIGEKISVSPLQISSFSDFALKQIRTCNNSVTLCVTNAQLDQLEADRQAALQDAINNAGSIGKPESEEPGHVHSYIDNLVAPTCTEKGYTVYSCACGVSYQDIYTDPTGHIWDDWVTTVQPTPQLEGTKERKCISCTTTETQQLPKLEAGHIHSYTPKVVAATCTTDGYTLYICSCGNGYRCDAVKATGHCYTNSVVAPTCTSGGYTLHSCACGVSYKDAATPAVSHNWGDWVVTKEATTTVEGSKQRSCKDCKFLQETTIAKVDENPIAGYVYINIRCDTILDNMDELNPAKAEFVPEDGEILPMVSVYFYEGETVFEVLERVCKIANIQLEYSWTPLYSSYYIEGINHLYEFDCGEQSGWMYKVNEWFPNYGCSSYDVSDGDVIVWCYTCKGLGADVGDDWMAHE